MGCVVAAALGACHGGVAAPRERLFPQPSPERVAEMMFEIESPTEPTNYDGLGPGYPAGDPRNEDDVDARVREYGRASDEVEDLAAVEAPIDADVVAILRRAKTWDTRCRATRVLALRGHPEAAALLARLARAEDPATRCVGWDLCADHARPIPPVPPDEARRRLEEERVWRIRVHIERYLDVVEGRRTQEPGLAVTHLAQSEATATVVKSGDANAIAAALLDLVEADATPANLRRSAVATLGWGHYSLVTYEARLSRIYARELTRVRVKDVDQDLCDSCVRALGDSRVLGLTDSMLRHAQVWRPHGRAWARYPLIRAINRRLGLTLKTLDEARALAVSRGIR